MIGELTNHLWQSAVFAVVAALLAAALRENRAHVRYWVWFIASLKFFVPFSLLIVLGTRLAWTPPASRIVASEVPAVSVALDQVAQPFTGVFPSAPATAPSAVDWVSLSIAFLWACGFVAIGLIRLRGWRRIRAAVRASAPLEIPSANPRVQIRSAPGLLEPGVVGWRRPVLLLPADITERLTPPQLTAVIAHELCHVRRRDNLTAAIHMMVEAIFWFHPGIWLIGARLLDERERACDEDVLTLGTAPQDYAEGILNVCKLYVESPLVCVAGVTGSNLKRRIAAILTGHTAHDLNIVRKFALTMAAISALAVPLGIGMMTAPLRAVAAPQSEPQSQTPQKFEVASIRPCEPRPVPPGGRGGGGGNFSLSPGRFTVECMKLEHLINIAYVTNGGRLLNDDMAYERSRGDRPQRIRGGPAWTRSDRYTIEAKAAGTPDRKVMTGPMLRALLEDRFQLRIHREVEEGAAMYALTVAKGGLKIKPWGPDGGCTPWDRTTTKPPPMDEVIEMVRRGEKPPCGLGVMGGERGSNKTLALGGQTAEGIAVWLSAILDRHVLDKTGIDGRFNLYLEYAPDEHTPTSAGGAAVDAASDPSSGPTIFRALEQQLGLKLEPTKGPRGYIVIDRVERPSLDGGPPR